MDPITAGLIGAGIGAAISGTSIFALCGKVVNNAQAEIGELESENTRLRASQERMAGKLAAAIFRDPKTGRMAKAPANDAAMGAA